jgi:hypothetical protein
MLVGWALRSGHYGDHDIVPKRPASGLHLGLMPRSSAGREGANPRTRARPSRPGPRPYRPTPFPATRVVLAMIDRRGRRTTF